MLTRNIRQPRRYRRPRAVPRKLHHAICPVRQHKCRAPIPAPEQSRVCGHVVRP